LSHGNNCPELQHCGALFLRANSEIESRVAIKLAGFAISHQAVVPLS
jgi:hypothetical protein